MPGKALLDALISFFGTLSRYGEAILAGLEKAVAAMRGGGDLAAALFNVLKDGLRAALTFLIKWLKLDKFTAAIKNGIKAVASKVKDAIVKLIKLIGEKIAAVFGGKSVKDGGADDDLDVKVYPGGAIQFSHGGHTYTIDANGGINKCSECGKVTDPTELKELESLIQKAKKKAGAKKDKGKYRGGRHRFTKGPKGDNLESHHTPAAAINGLDRDDGPAIQMEPEDHRDTASHGTDPQSPAYHARQKKLIDEGQFGAAIQLDIDDVRGQFKTKYDQAIREMLASIDPWMAKGLKSTTI